MKESFENFEIARQDFAQRKRGLAPKQKYPTLGQNSKIGPKIGHFMKNNQFEISRTKARFLKNVQSAKKIHILMILI